MGVAAALGDLENVVDLQTIDDQVAVEVVAEDVFGNVAAAAVANDIDGSVLGAEDPEPGV